jgi:4-aminobutyrate aminotransferase-like enzyme
VSVLCVFGQVPLPDVFRGQFTGPEAPQQYVEAAREVVRSVKTKGGAVAAFYAESIVACGGQVRGL